MRARARERARERESLGGAERRRLLVHDLVQQLRQLQPAPCRVLRGFKPAPPQGALNSWRRSCPAARPAPAGSMPRCKGPRPRFKLAICSCPAARPARQRPPPRRRAARQTLFVNRRVARGFLKLRRIAGSWDGFARHRMALNGLARLGRQLTSPPAPPAAFARAGNRGGPTVLGARKRGLRGSKSVNPN